MRHPNFKNVFPMKIIITGGGGFLGQRVACELLKRGKLDDADGKAQPIRELVLLDVALPLNGLLHPKVRYAIGDAASPKFIAETLGEDTDGVFHLAAVVSGAAEADFDLGMRNHFPKSNCRQRVHQYQTYPAE
jgi:D-erythronate 2-dehydrogenase